MIEMWVLTFHNVQQSLCPMASSLKVVLNCNSENQIRDNFSNHQSNHLEEFGNEQKIKYY
jgi:hypothetical protein